MKPIFLSFCFLLSLLSVAQIDISTNSIGAITIARSIVPLLESSKTLEDFDPWLFDGDRFGELNHVNYKGKGILNYNYMSGVVKIEISGSESSFTAKDIIDFYVLDGDVNRHFISFSFEDFKISPSIVEVIELSKFDILINREVILRKGDYNPSLNVGSPDKYVVRSVLYLRNKRTNVVSRVSGKRELISSLGGDSSLSLYWKENGLSFEIGSVVQIVNYASQL